MHSVVAPHRTYNVHVVKHEKPEMDAQAITVRSGYV